MRRMALAVFLVAYYPIAMALYLVGMVVGAAWWPLYGGILASNDNVLSACRLFKKEK